MGVLPQHVPAIEQLQPGVMEVIEAGGARKKFFCGAIPSSYHASFPLSLALENNQSNGVLIFLRFAVSGGFAIIQPGSELDVNAVEGYPLEEFSIEVRSHCWGLLEAENVEGLTTFVLHLRLCMHKQQRHRRSQREAAASKISPKRRWS
jgi:hypothetical protein